LQVTLVLKEIFAFIVKNYNIDYIIKIPYENEKQPSFDFSTAVLLDNEEYDIKFKQNIFTSTMLMLKVKQIDLIIIFEDKEEASEGKGKYKYLYGNTEIDLKTVINMEVLKPEQPQPKLLKKVTSKKESKDKESKEKENKEKESKEKETIDINADSGIVTYSKVQSNKYAHNIKVTEESMKSSRLKLSLKDQEEISKMTFATIKNYE